MISDIDTRGLIEKSLSTYSPILPLDNDALGRLKVRTRIFDPGSYIFREGLLSSDYAFSISGHSFRQKQTVSGYRQIVSLIIPGDLVNPENRFQSQLDHNVICAEQTIIAYVKTIDFNTLLSFHPSIDRALNLLMVEELRQLREWLLNIGGRSARIRVAHFLNEFAARTKLRGLSDGLRFALPMSQEQIGDSVGITPVHVNRSIKSLVDSGFIKHKNRKYEIVDPVGFREAGEFSEYFIRSEETN